MPIPYLVSRRGAPNCPNLRGAGYAVRRCGTHAHRGVTARSRAPRCLRLVLEVVATSPAHAAAVTPRGRLGGSGGARHATPELTLSYALKPTPRRPLESRYKFVRERSRMLQRAERTCQDPYHGIQPYPAPGARVGTLWTPAAVVTADAPGLGGVWPTSTFAI